MIKQTGLHIDPILTRPYLPRMKSYSAKLLLTLMAHRTEDNRFTQKQLMELSGLSSASVQFAIQELEDLGVLERYAKGVGGNRYHAPAFELIL